jgi:hypothetical protein
MQGKDLPICLFADKIAGGLQLRVRKVLPQRLRKEAAAGSVKRKGNGLGESTTKKLTRKQKDNEGRSVGSSKQATCFVCKKYCTKYNYTTFVCREWWTPLCQVDRSTDAGRGRSRINEDGNSGDHRLRCKPGTKRMNQVPERCKGLHVITY